MNSGKGENGSESSNSRPLKSRVAAASIKELDQLASAGPVEQGAPDVVQRRRDRLARLLIRIRRGEAGYDVAKKFLHENEGLPPTTEV
ncbi:MAG: hypothetical protein QOH31_4289 [Verrucomicrobiota bacterium]|jgi:hypothetical protein